MAQFRLSHAEVAVLSYLLGSPAPQRQVHIAAATGVTQARVSQIMAIADTRGWTERCAEGWRVLRPRAVFDHLVTARPPRVTTVEAWYSLDNGPRQIELALERAAAQRVSLHVCGDWAADRIAPWRIPEIVVLHADARLELDEAGFVPVDTDPSDASLVVTIGKSPPGWRLDAALAAAMGGLQAQVWPLAPVIEVARHMLIGNKPDAAEAVAELEERFLSARAELERAA
ncbi:hypothetical protein AB0M22_03650 [Nocardia sp. NPDC051756]|uniref:hypothetical protein n=1 Tax=Nocardia sp. NPDC051756 TaxID=3154751 RepID=UPI003435CB8E